MTDSTALQLRPYVVISASNNVFSMISIKQVPLITVRWFHMLLSHVSVDRLDPRNKWRIMYVLEWRTASALTIGLFWCLFPELRSNEGNEYQNDTRVSAETVRHESTYIILFLTRLNESTNDYKHELYTSLPCLTRSVFVLLMTSQSIADDVTMTRQLWCDHVNNDI